MRRLFFIGFMVCAVCSWAHAGFDSCFDDATLCVSVNVVRHGDGRGLRIDSVSQWQGWWGRRVNLDKLLYPDDVIFSLTDNSTGDTIYIDSKYLTYTEATAANPQRAVILVPKPKVPATLTVSCTSWRGGSLTNTLDCSDLILESSHTPATDYVMLRDAADPEHAVSLAIVAEGYTRAEMQRFLSDASRLDSALFAHPAFNVYANRFNVAAVMLESAESGVSRPSKDEVVNSALGSHFDSYSLDRLITIPDPRPLWHALACVPAQHVMILANTESYGGSGPYNDYAIASAGHPQSHLIIIHEFGHSFANLGDEYEAGYEISYSPDVEPIEPNITTLHDFASKWQDMVDSGEATLIEGAGYQSKGVWRSSERCLMRALPDKHFCPVCTRAIGRTITFYVAE